MSGVWIVHELAEIHDLLEQAGSRSIALSMKMHSHAEALDRQATTEPAKAAIADSVRIAHQIASDSAKIHSDVSGLLEQAAQAVKNAAEIIR